MSEGVRDFSVEILLVDSPRQQLTIVLRDFYQPRKTLSNPFLLRRILCHRAATTELRQGTNVAPA